MDDRPPLPRPTVPAIGDYIMPFVPEHWASAPPVLPPEVLVNVPPQELAQQAVACMGSCALLTHGALLSKVFRGGPVPREYRDDFLKAVVATPGVTEIAPLRNHVKTVFAIARTPEDEERLVQLRDVQRTVLDRLRLPAVPREMPISVILNIAQAEAERRSLPWDPVARNIVGQLLYADIRAVKPGSVYSVRSQKQAASMREHMPGSGWAQIVRRVDLAKWPYNRTEPHERAVEVTPEEHRQTPWVLAPGMIEFADAELHFATVGEAVDYFVGLCSARVSIQGFTSIDASVTKGRKLTEETDWAFREALLHDMRFQLLGRSDIRGDVFLLQPQGAPDPSGMRSLPPLAEEVVAAAREYGFLQELPARRLIRKTLAALDRKAEDHRITRLCKVLEAHSAVSAAYDSKGELTFRVKPIRERKITRGGQPIEKPDVDVLRQLLDVVVGDLDENVVSVTKDHLIQRVRERNPDLPPIANHMLGRLMTQHIRLSPRDGFKGSFNFHPKPQAESGPEKRPVIVEFDALGTIKRTNQ